MQSNEDPGQPKINKRKQHVLHTKKQEPTVNGQANRYIYNLLVTYHTASGIDLLIDILLLKRYIFTQMVVSKRQRQREEE